MVRGLVVAVIVVVIIMMGATLGGLSASQRPSATHSAAMLSESVSATESSNGTADFPPGASAEGIENATRLMEAHRTELVNTSYSERAEWEEVDRLPTRNGTYRKFTTYQYTMAVEKGERGTEVRVDTENDSTRYWFSDGATTVNYSSRNSGPTSTLFEHTRGNGFPADFETYMTTYSSRYVHPYLHYLDYEHVRTTTQNGSTLFTYSSTGVNESAEWTVAPVPILSTTDEINATVTVSRRGIIRSFTVRERHSTETDSVTIESTFSVEGIGELNASVPQWTTDEVAQFDVSLTTDDSAVALTHTGGPQVTDPELVFDTPGGSNRTTVDGTIESDDTVYVYLTTERLNRTLRSRINDRPSVNSSFVPLGAGNVSITAWRNVFGSGESSVQLEVAIRERPAPPVRERPIHPIREHPLRTVNLGNEANETYRFEAWISEIGSSLTVRRSSGDSHTFELGTANGFGSESVKQDPVTAVELPDSAQLYGKYTLESGEKMEAVMREIRHDEVLVVVVVNEVNDTILGLHGVHCGSVFLADLTLSVRDSQEPELGWSSSCGPKREVGGLVHVAPGSGPSSPYNSWRSGRPNRSALALSK